MSADHKRLDGEQGMVLYSSLLILSLLVIIGLGARVMLRTDFQILANLRGSTDAFYLAEAGIEWGKDQINSDLNHPPNPANRAQNFASGNFSVAFLSPKVVTPLVASIGVRSTGGLGNSSHVLQAQITKTYDLTDGAVSLRGNANRVAFGGNPLLISGIDHEPVTAQALTAAKSRFAISVSDETLQARVVQGLSSAQQTGNIETGEDSSAISQSRFISGPAIVTLTNDLCSSPQALRSFVSSDGTLSLEDQTWGTRTSPQLRCVEGFNGPGDAVNFGGGIGGAGILVVRNADLVVNGSFRWEGLIIVTGNNVSFRTNGVDSKEIYGSLIINETGTPESGTALLDIQGNLRVLFSRPALSRIVSLVPTPTLQAAYSALPSMIAQEYWRTMIPQP
jgi:hypothetical protein